MELTQNINKAISIIDILLVSRDSKGHLPVTYLGDTGNQYLVEERRKYMKRAGLNKNYNIQTPVCTNQLVALKQFRSFTRGISKCWKHIKRVFTIVLSFMAYSLENFVSSSRNISAYFLIRSSNVAVNFLERCSSCLY